MVPILCSENFRLMLNPLPEFYQLPYQTKYIDIGNDNLHPGPGQHQFYADAILKIINHG